MDAANGRWTATLALAALLIGAPALAGSRIERQFDLAPGSSFELDADAGTVTVRGTASPGARVLITSRVDDLESRFRLDSKVEGDRLVVRFQKLDANGAFSWLNWSRGENLEIEIEVPHSTELNIDTAGGSINAQAIDAQVRLDTSGGSIVAERIGGDVVADTSGGSIMVTDAGGDVSADTSGGSITVEKVRGDVKADTSGGSITISNVDGAVVADTSGGSISISGVGGSIRADTSGGSVEVEFAAGNTQGGYLSTSGGGIRVRLDAGANLDLDAEASGGSATSDIPVTLEGKASKTRILGKIGAGGPLLKLRASGGKIQITPL